MGIFLTAATALFFVFLAMRQMLEASGEVGPTGEKKKVSPYILLSVAFHLVCSFRMGEGLTFTTPFAILVGLVAYCSLCFLPLADVVLKKIALVVVCVGLSFGLYGLLHVFAGCPLIPYRFYVSGTFSLPVIISAIYIYGIYRRLKNIKPLMKIGTPWTTICICVDSVYVNILMVMSVVFCITNMFADAYNEWNIMLYTLSLALFQCALVVRVSKASAFVLWKRHERKIIEAMKLTFTDMVGDNNGSEMLYKSIYDRVQEYFETDKPYLKHDLTINDVVSVVFTNKLYISKAISQYAGKNFCQFVNYYRISYAVELFRSDPSLKIVDMAAKSGFNSSVSFSMAFRLYMGEKPGDWCRKERSLLEIRRK